MRRFVNIARIVILLILVAALTMVYISALYRLQLYKDSSDPENLSALNTSTSRITLDAARGDILDRNGVPLIASRATYGITLSRDQLLNAVDTNGELMRIIETAREYGVAYTDTFPITMEAPFSYTSMDEQQTYCFEQYLDFFGLRHDILASDLIVWLKDHYEISFTTSLNDARRIIGLRYELELRVIVNIDPYVFASDVDADFIAVMKERGFIGVNTTTDYIRECFTASAGHLLGYTAYMDSEQYEYYEKLGYPMNAQVGQAGAEKAFEEYLHGKDGILQVTTLEDGTVVSEKVIEPAQPGQNVYLSLDIELQKACEDYLSYLISDINSTRPDPNDWATGGALVVVQPKTGQVLASVSYPFYDPSTLSEDYDRLLAAPNQPLFNRAANGIYNPGSTFKMVTGFAGLKTGFIKEFSTYTDLGVYTAYEDYQPVCWIYSNTGGGHGELDLVGAIQNSCNVFFYWVGDNIGIDALSSAAKEFGLGVPTGIEVDEDAGTLSTPEYKATVDPNPWYPADTIIASIGQGYNMFTPIQLANYCATIANGGTHYALTLLSKTKSADYAEVTHAPDPRVLNSIAEKDYIRILQKGMEAVTVGEGSAQPMFEDAPVKVAAKTGTVQSDGTTLTNGVFICYAPADDPEIAVAVVVEKGKSGVNIMSAARRVVDYYFSEKEEEHIAAEYTLLP